MPDSTRDLPDLPSVPAQSGGRPVRMQRNRGAARVVVGPSGLADLYQKPPCRVLFPRVEKGEPPAAVMVTTSGGMTGGDRIDYEVTVAPGARATLTTQAAEKIYRSLGDEAEMEVRLEVGAGGYLEWLPQESILFNRSNFVRHTHVILDPTATLLAVEAVVFGRIAHGESVTECALHDAWRIRVGGRLRWADGLSLDAETIGRLHDPYAFGGALAVATVVVYTPDCAGRLETARALLEKALKKETKPAFDVDGELEPQPSPRDTSAAPDSLKAGVTLVSGLLVTRFVGRDTAELRGCLMDYLMALRAELTGLPPRLPRVWRI
jgi:urease accessory protein